MTNEIKFADVLKELISKKGITQTALAEYLGLKSQTVSLYCNGKSYPELNNLLKIASYFGVSTDYLITGKKTENKSARELLNLSDSAIDNIKKHSNDKNFKYFDMALADNQLDWIKQFTFMAIIQYNKNENERIFFL